MRTAAEWADEWPEGPCKTIDQVDFLQQATPEQAERFILAIQREAAEAQRSAIYDYIRIDWPGCLTCASLIQSAPLVTGAPEEKP